MNAGQDGFRYPTAIIAGAVIGIFTSLIPTSLSLPPLLVAFLLGYSVDIFTAPARRPHRYPGGQTNLCFRLKVIPALARDKSQSYMVT
jgi:hypothetical protein